MLMVQVSPSVRREQWVNLPSLVRADSKAACLPYRRVGETRCERGTAGRGVLDRERNRSYLTGKGAPILLIDVAPSFTGELQRLLLGGHPGDHGPDREEEAPLLEEWAAEPYASPAALLW